MGMIEKLLVSNRLGRYTSVGDRWEIDLGNAYWV